MIYDTLSYTDAGGNVQEIALSLPNLAAVGAAVTLEFTPASHAPGTFKITWAQPPETGINIPFKSRCIVCANRVSATGAQNSFTVGSGSILFQGRRTDNQGSASATRVITTITLSDLLWDFQHVTYTIPWQYPNGGTTAAPTFGTFNWPDIVLFQAAPGAVYNPVPVSGTITTWQQISALVAFAAGYAAGVDAIQVQLGTSLTGGAEFAPVYTNWYPQRSSKLAEALKVCLRPHPGVFTQVDHTTTPPTLHFRNRANMTATTLPYKSTDVNGVIHIASDIESLDQLVPDNVRLFYKINSTINNQPAIGFAEDAYPNNANHLLSADYSIDITGAATSQTIVNFVSTVFDPTNLALWQTRCASLKSQGQAGGQLIDLAIVEGSITVTDDTNAAINYTFGNFQFYTDSPVWNWMIQAGGGAVAIAKATVSAKFSYQKQTTIAGKTITEQTAEHLHTFRIILTNAATNEYILKQTLNTGESIPPGLAQAVYTELSVLQWKLKHEIIQVAANSAAVPLLVQPGKHCINLAGGTAAWTTMNAVPEQVTIKFYRTADNRLVAHHVISCGPVNHLEPGYLVELRNLFINRNRSGIDAYQRLTGAVASTQSDLSNTGNKENSIPANPVQSVTAVLAPDGSVGIYQDTLSGQHTINSAGGKIGLNVKVLALYNDPTNGGAVTGGESVELPDGSTITLGGAKDSLGNFHTLSINQVVTCEDDGTNSGTTAEFCRLILCSDRFGKPAGW